MSIPVMDFNNSPARCMGLPLPLVAKVRSPGRALASSISSWTLFAGTALDNQEARRQIDLRYRRELLHRIKRQLVQAGINNNLRLDCDCQRIAIWSRLRHALRRNISGRTG